MLKSVLIFIFNLTLILLLTIVPILLSIWLIVIVFPLSEKSISNICELLSIVFTVMGGIFAYKKWDESNRIKRAEFIKQIIEKLRFDENMVKVMYKIDYEDKWYDKNFHGSNSEIEIDKLLTYMSYICYIYKMKNIKSKEFKILCYELKRTCLSHDVQSYLWNLYHFSKKQKTDCMFQYLIDYGIKNNIIDEALFFDSNCKKYTKHLNF